MLLLDLHSRLCSLLLIGVVSMTLSVRGLMVRFNLIAAAFGILLSCDFAFAQQGGTEQERRACGGSVQRYCRAAIGQGDFAVLGCLQQNRSRISAPCRRVLADHGQ